MAPAPRTYYVIDSHLANPPRRVYRVWERTGTNASAVLVGQFSSLEEAKLSVNVVWRDPSTKLIEALGFSRVVAGNEAANATISQAGQVVPRMSEPPPTR